MQSHAATAFTDAFNLASGVSVGIAVAAAVGLLWLSRGRRDDTAPETLPDFDAELDTGSEVELIPVTAGTGPE